MAHSLINQYNNLIESGGHASSVEQHNKIMSQLSSLHKKIDTLNIRYYIDDNGYIKEYGTSSPANN